MLARYPHEISGGQRQRVVIAAAIVAKPGLIVLDEPTTALDKTVETQVLDLVSELHESLATTLVYVSHDLNVIGRMCDRVLVVRNGCALEDGGVHYIFRSPVNQYARDLVRAIPRLEARPARPAPTADPPALTINDFTLRYRSRSHFLRRLGHKERAEEPTLSKIGFVLPRVRTLGIVGESGSGKSTLARILAGLVGGYSGDIRIIGQTAGAGLASRPADLKRRVQMIFQDPISSLNPVHRRRPRRPSAPDSFRAQPACCHRTRSAPARRAGPAGKRDDAAATPALRRATAARCDRPRLRLRARHHALREITLALDVTVQASVLRLMKRLQEERGTSYLFISHDLPVVAEMSDQLMVLERGMIRDLGNTAEILASPKSEYKRKLVAAFTRVAAEIPERKMHHVS